MTGPERRVQVLVIGGGQAGLAAGYYLRRAGLDFAILDAARTPGGAWQHYWESLRLFSPAAYSSLPGRPMPHQAGQEHPDAAHVVDYLTEYEKRYELPVHRPVHVRTVGEAGDGGLLVRTDDGTWHTRALISATGSWPRPFVPAVPGRETFTGRQLHARDYHRAEDFTGQRVVVVGGGNSGAQIAADLLDSAGRIRRSSSRMTLPTADDSVPKRPVAGYLRATPAGRFSACHRFRSDRKVSAAGTSTRLGCQGSPSPACCRRTHPLQDSKTTRTVRRRRGRKTSMTPQSARQPVRSRGGPPCGRRVAQPSTCSEVAQIGAMGHLGR
ncbi:NAD(P)-binding domain-containing protein [Kitasatospora sp. NPDC004723]|uniref:NAD(P)-binding domain-containing protein n=1 Tax=Kitasatospora sp. NPDC004723 TaxID=3154288 RepID=UPI00339DF469